MRDACCATEEKYNIQQKQKLVQSSTTSTSITSSLDDTLNDAMIAMMNIYYLKKQAKRK